MTTAGMAMPMMSLRYAPPIETEIARLAETLAGIPALAGYPARWLAIQLLEGDETLLAEVEAAGGA